MIAHRQTEMMAERRRSAEGDDRAAGFDELLQLRNRLLDRHASELVLVFRRDVGGRRLTAATATAAAAFTLGNPAVGEEQHVVLRLEVAGVERAREHHLERELELLEHEADPA